MFINIEDGDLAVHDVLVPHVRPQSWPDFRDLVVRIAGPNPSFGPNEPYSQAHFDRVGGYLPGIENYRTIFFDSLTAAGAFTEACGNPERAIKIVRNWVVVGPDGITAAEFKQKFVDRIWDLYDQMDEKP